GASTYTFEVKACNNNGIWNEKPARLTLIISPPWWSTRWFYTLCILVISGTIYILFQYRLRQKLKAYELRNTISRDLHDEVGSTLSSIGFLSSMALNDVDNNNVKIHSTLNSISESSHKMLDAMNDIIWNIQPENDTLENIIARMLSFASELLEARKISLHFKIADDLKHLHLGVAVRHDFFVIYKEAVNNLAKYSEASEAHINLEFHHPCLMLTIRDNGKGFDPEKIKSGNGLKNMESRAKKIGAVYHLHTVAGEGTTITLQVNPHDNVGKRNGRII
ncbi:MAG TPA: histidine kinase, partial [Chitinophagaceae bacterium]|nr:histidine kinase [Chitinophagaceae bacterium]